VQVQYHPRTQDCAPGLKLLCPSPSIPHLLRGCRCRDSRACSDGVTAGRGKKRRTAIGNKAYSLVDEWGWPPRRMSTRPAVIRIVPAIVIIFFPRAGNEPRTSSPWLRKSG